MSHITSTQRPARLAHSDHSPDITWSQFPAIERSVRQCHALVRLWSQKSWKIRPPTILGNLTRLRSNVIYYLGCGEPVSCEHTAAQNHRTSKVMSPYECATWTQCHLHNLQLGPQGWWLSLTCGIGVLYTYKGQYSAGLRCSFSPVYN